MNNSSSGQDNGSEGLSSKAAIYWQSNLKILGALLTIWFAVSFGAGVLFVDELDSFSLFGFPLGFWFAQQGSIYVFVLLIFVYWRLMQRLERNLDVGDDDEEGDRQ